MVPAEARKIKTSFRSQAHHWERFGFKRQQTVETKQLIRRKALLFKPRDSETAFLEDLRNHALLNENPYSGSKKSIHPDGVLTQTILPNYKPSQKYTPPGRAFCWCLQKPGKGKQTFEAKPLIRKALD